MRPVRSLGVAGRLGSGSGAEGDASFGCAGSAETAEFEETAVADDVVCVVEEAAGW